jgi:hypothetical protein
MTTGDLERVYHDHDTLFRLLSSSHPALKMQTWHHSIAYTSRILRLWGVILREWYKITSVVGAYWLALTNPMHRHDPSWIDVKASNNFVQFHQWTSPVDKQAKNCCLLLQKKQLSDYMRAPFGTRRIHAHTSPIGCERCTEILHGIYIAAATHVCS